MESKFIICTSLFCAWVPSWKKGRKVQWRAYYWLRHPVEWVLLEFAKEIGSGGGKSIPESASGKNSLPALRRRRRGEFFNCIICFRRTYIIRKPKRISFCVNTTNKLDVISLVWARARRLLACSLSFFSSSSPQSPETSSPEHDRAVK